MNLNLYKNNSLSIEIYKLKRSSFILNRQSLINKVGKF